jgi:hypothetical protein
LFSVHGKWSEWIILEDCTWSNTSAGWLYKRQRLCNSPRSEYGGDTCGDSITIDANGIELEIEDILCEPSKYQKCPSNNLKN